MLNCKCRLEPNQSKPKRKRGRPPKAGGRMIQTAVWLPKEQIEYLKSHGNLSEQIRALITREMQTTK